MKEQIQEESFRRTQMLRWLCAIGIASILLLLCGEANAAAQVYLKDDAPLQPGSCVSAAEGHLPVLFVHGHKSSFTSDPDPNYKINWQKSFNGLPSFKDALLQNNHLGIEPYYIHFTDQHHSIAQDAADIADAVEKILIRHDPNCVSGTPGTLNAATDVKVAIIAYSKGTISTRLFLKNSQQYGFTFNPISEFVALSPPNHGLNIADGYTFPSTSLRQLNNGYKQDCSSYLFPPDNTVEFIGELNGTVPLVNTANASLGSVTDEAPGSRPNGSAVTDGTLYVALFADNGRDFVGGLNPSGQCGGRVRAANLSPDAENRELSEIATGQTDTSIADSPVHQATVHTPEVMCLALSSVVHHRFPESEQPGENFQCQMVNGVPIIPPQVALVQVLDISGSMLGLACDTCDEKLEVLKEAVQIFLDLWTLTAGPADIVGFQVFGTLVTPLDPTGLSLMPVTDANVMDVRSDVEDISTVPNNLTAMGGGLQRAIEVLQDPVIAETPQRHIVLFTDGMQNVNPMADKINDPSPPGAFHYEIVDIPGFPASNVSASGVNLKELEGIKIHTIGVGATQQFMTLLTEIAGQTSGATWLTLDPDQDLRPFYVQTLIEALRGNSPQLAGYRRGTLADDAGIERFAVGRGGRRVVLKLSWKKGRDFSFTVLKDGIDINAAGQFVDRGFYRLFFVDVPFQIGGQTINSEGEWQMRISGRKGEDYQAAAIVDESSLDYRLGLINHVLKAGDPLQFKLRLSSKGIAITGASKVQAAIRRPGESVANLLAQAPMNIAKSGTEVEGAGGARTKLQRLLELKSTQTKLAPVIRTISLNDLGDGSYAGETTATEVPGPYTISVTVEGEDAQFGKYHRQESVSALVLTGDLDVTESDLRLTQSSVAAGVRNMVLSVTPRDRFRNYLGPDYENAIHLTIAGKRIAPQIQDLLNGSYTIAFEIPEDDDPMMSISILDKPLFEGSLSALEERPFFKRTLLWLLMILVLVAVLILYLITIRAR